MGQIVKYVLQIHGIGSTRKVVDIVNVIVLGQLDKSVTIQQGNVNVEKVMQVKSVINVLQDIITIHRVRNVIVIYEDQFLMGRSLLNVMILVSALVKILLLD